MTIEPSIDILVDPDTVLGPKSDFQIFMCVKAMNEFLKELDSKDNISISINETLFKIILQEAKSRGIPVDQII